MSDTGRRTFLAQFAAGSLCLQRLASAAPPQGPAKPLNLVLILVDDLGWADVGCFGSKFHSTPNIDRLCHQGMKFTNAYAAAPVCSPTRASIMTGKSPARLQMTDIVQGHRPSPKDPLLAPEVRPALPLEEVTIAETLKTAGYISACIGKWHLGAKGFYPEDQGFAVNVGGTHIGMPNNFFFPDWKLSRNGPLAAVGAVPIDGQPGEYLTDRLTDAATSFIEENRDRPFFLYLAHYAVHIPMQAKTDLIERYERKADPADAQRNPIYAAMVDSVDQSVGKVMRKLDEMGIAGNTAVLFMSDNGGLLTPMKPNNLPPTSNLPLREGKGHLYEGGIREPMIVKWPGVVKPGSVCDVPVISTDFYPTLVAMAGIKADPGHPVDGLSLLPLLKQTGKLKRDTLYWHWPHYAIPTALPAAAIRRGDLKLIEFFEDARVELYNLAHDPGEKSNLVNKLPKKAAELQAALHAWQKSLHAGGMRPNPDYRPAVVNQ
ncbi:MAG: DUF4976 domain-containing protein [Bryobacterales bacterium]|nr:DUF4976 domain-containing protein [Bryobacterales bacterium]